MISINMLDLTKTGLKQAIPDLAETEQLILARSHDGALAMLLVKLTPTLVIYQPDGQQQVFLIARPLETRAYSTDATYSIQINANGTQVLVTCGNHGYHFIYKEQNWYLDEDFTNQVTYSAWLDLQTCEGVKSSKSTVSPILGSNGSILSIYSGGPLDYRLEIRGCRLLGSCWLNGPRFLGVVAALTTDTTEQGSCLRLTFHDEELRRVNELSWDGSSDEYSDFVLMKADQGWLVLAFTHELWIFYQGILHRRKSITARVLKLKLMANQLLVEVQEQEQNRTWMMHLNPTSPEVLVSCSLPTDPLTAYFSVDSQLFSYRLDRERESFVLAEYKLPKSPVSLEPLVCKSENKTDFQHLFNCSVRQIKERYTVSAFASEDQIKQEQKLALAALERDFNRNLQNQEQGQYEVEVLTDKYEQPYGVLKKDKLIVQLLHWS